MNFELDHKPVLIDSIISYLKNDPSKKESFLDLTFGAGGYTKRILNEFENSKIICVDQDPSVEKYYNDVNENFPNRSQFFCSNFSNIHKKINETGIIKNFDVIVFDLGVSSMQLDDKSRGFSFYGDGNALDMRMNQDDESLESAYEFINYSSESEIADIIYYYGEESHARKIARNIVKKREIDGKIKTTKELGDLISKIIPFKKHYGSSNKVNIHPATKTFQAIRIHVNKEFDSLVLGLQNLISFLNQEGGKMIIVSFHSLEDRIIKNFFTYMDKGEFFDEGFKKHFEIIRQKEKDFFASYKFEIEKKIFTPTNEEIHDNIRSRSAKMRILKRIE